MLRVQDAVKKITGDELPDFYNIVLERPKDDPDGYDVLFIDAAAKVWGDGGIGACRKMQLRRCCRAHQEEGLHDCSAGLDSCTL